MNRLPFLRFWLPLILLLSAGPLAASPDQPPVGLVRIPATALDLPGGPADWGDVWEVEREEGWALLAIDAGDAARLDAEGIPWSWDWERSARMAESTPDLSCYVTVDRMEQELFGLASDHPGLVQLRDYGDSWLKATANDPGGHDLWLVRISAPETDDRPKPAFFCMGAIHARELATAEIARELIHRLVDGYGVDPDITGLLREVAVYVAPMTNPDGRVEAEAGKLWRKNVDDRNGCSTAGKYGTDLNRNSTWMWNHGGSSADPCDETYRGPSAGSEAEVQALEGFFPELWTPRADSSDAIPADEEATTGMMITLHSYAQWILRPLGYVKKASANENSLRPIGDRFGDFTGYRSGISSIALYIASGATDDVAYALYGVPAFTFEVGNAFFEPCSTLPKVVADNVAALLWGIRIARQPYRLVFGPEVSVTSPNVVRVTAGEPARFDVTAKQFAGRSAIGEIRASVDRPAWRGGESASVAVPVPNDSASATASLSVPTSGLPPGRHLVWLDAVGSDGQAGGPTAAFVDVADAPERPEHRLDHSRD